MTCSGGGDRDGGRGQCLCVGAGCSEGFPVHRLRPQGRSHSYDTGARLGQACKRNVWFGFLMYIGSFDLSRRDNHYYPGSVFPSESSQFPSSACRARACGPEPEEREGCALLSGHERHATRGWVHVSRPSTDSAGCGVTVALPSAAAFLAPSRCARWLLQERGAPPEVPPVGRGPCVLLCSSRKC